MELSEQPEILEQHVRAHAGGSHAQALGGLFGKTDDVTSGRPPSRTGLSMSAGINCHHAILTTKKRHLSRTCWVTSSSMPVSATSRRHLGIRSAAPTLCTPYYTPMSASNPTKQEMKRALRKMRTNVTKVRIIPGMLARRVGGRERAGGMLARRA